MRRFCVFAFNKIIERKSGKYLEYFIKLPTFATANAEIAQLVEHNLGKGCPDGGIGRHEGLKIPWPVMAVRVQVPLRVQVHTNNPL